MSVVENIQNVRAKIAAAAEKSGRTAEDVLLLAVSKTKPVELIGEAVQAGCLSLGENKVQEIMEKYEPMMEYAPEGERIHWHLIGHLQTNKVKYIIDKVSMIHSVDSYKLAAEIDKRAGAKGITMDILLQVNSAQEESKFGITTAETEDLIHEILENCENIRLRGLMCVAPFAEDPEDIKVYFDEVKKQYDQFAGIEHPHLDFKYLSMGMSHDFKVAIEAGSNLVRVGSAIFGARDYSKK